jgi:hypothetical protein
MLALWFTSGRDERKCLSAFMTGSPTIDHDRALPWGGATRPRSDKTMKSLLLATTTAVVIGLLGICGASAAPIHGAAIGQAVAGDQLTQQVHWYWRHRHCWWHRGHRICRRW